MAILAKHPQRLEFIEALCKGESASSIARRSVPKVSHVQLCALAKVVRADLQAAQAVTVARQLVANSTQVNTNCVIPATDSKEVRDLMVRAASAEPHLQRISKRQEQLDRLIESETDGKTAAALIRADLASVELAGRFDRSLEGPSQGNTTVHNYMVLPSTYAPPQAPPEVQEGETLDCEYEETDDTD